MSTANFEYTGNTGILSLVTYFDQHHHIACCKGDDEIFRLGGTAIDEVLVYEAILLRAPKSPDELGKFRAFRSRKPGDHFDGDCHVSPEDWSPADMHCYVTEFYPLDVEGKKPEWFASRHPIDQANCVFVNLDVLDGGGNVIKRYRVSPYTGECKTMEMLHDIR